MPATGEPQSGFVAGAGCRAAGRERQLCRWQCTPARFGPRAVSFGAGECLTTPYCCASLVAASALRAAARRWRGWISRRWTGRSAVPRLTRSGRWVAFSGRNLLGVGCFFDRSGCHDQTHACPATDVGREDCHGGGGRRCVATALPPTTCKAWQHDRLWVRRPPTWQLGAWAVLCLLPRSRKLKSISKPLAAHAAVLQGHRCHSGPANVHHRGGGGASHLPRRLGWVYCLLRLLPAVPCCPAAAAVPVAPWPGGRL